ncbi:hypothetical protein C7N43_22220 [Sphingobacteriales bacterium UPWRP_1]|nr:hypothetical protein BVG80_16380 [Sphingobacteriales bacterium TSM_CSM]PSJ74794.1 hypothetical protein C7N43_22220 [Sphingobacteriales bacterium UPWRP_1]
MTRISFILSVLTGVIVASNLLLAQQPQWIPEGVKNTTLLVERFKYQDPDMAYSNIDEMYEDDKIDFLTEANDHLEVDNQKLEEVFKQYKGKYVTITPVKLDEAYPDLNLYRFVLKRDLFYGRKKVLNPATSNVEDKSYFAYRYYFFDRVSKKNYPAYYFSGDTWTQLKRVVYWLNRSN